MSAASAHINKLLATAASMALVNPAEVGGEAASGSESSGLVARTGRERQRYEDSGARLVAGCVPRRGEANAGASGGTLAPPAN